PNAARPSAMRRVVLDASALLAVLNQAPGAAKLPPELLSTAAISTANLAELHGKLVRRGLSPDHAWEAALSHIREAVPLSSAHAKNSRAPQPSRGKLQSAVGAG